MGVVGESPAWSEEKKVLIEIRPKVCQMSHTKEGGVGRLGPPDEQPDCLAAGLDELDGVAVRHVLGGLAVDLNQLVPDLQPAVLGGGACNGMG